MPKFGIQDFDKQMEEIRQRHKVRKPLFSGLRDIVRKKLKGNQPTF